MDPLTALGIAGNVVQFIDFGLKTVSKAREIHSSSTGALRENVDLEAWAKDITSVTDKLCTARGGGTGNGNLDDICRRCIGAADELLSALNGMRVQEKSKWRSVRQALKSTWGKTRVEELRRSLEGWKHEIQFHVLIELKSSIDVESAKHSDRFDSLDDHAKAILETMSTNQNLTYEVIQSEITKSTDMHQQSTIAMLRTQERMHEEVKQSMEALGDQAQDTLQALSNNQELIQEAALTIISNQDTSESSLNKSLESMDASSRAEHEATRRELRQMKLAMKQIEEDMVRRDKELKELLVELGKSSNEKERRRLQEKSNAVTVALCALVTIYQGLQKMILGIQAQAKLILTTANLGQLWNEKLTLPSSKPNRAVQLTLVEALINQPPEYEPSLGSDTDKTFYLHQIYSRYGHFSTPLTRVWDSDWIGLGVVDYHNIGKNSGLNPVQLEIAKKEVRELLHVLYCPPMLLPANEDTEHSYDSELRQTEILALLKSMILISTVLVQCLSPVGAAKIIDAIDSHMRASPAIAESNNPPKVFRARTMGDPGEEEEEVRPAILFRRLLRHVTVWSTVGKIAGIQRVAELHLRSRIARWDASKPSMLAATIIGPQRFFTWLILKPEVPAFMFDIGATEAGRARGAVVYAIVEFLITFGFRLTTPTIEFGHSGLYALVTRLPSSEETVDKQISMEDVATRLFQPNFLNR